MTRTRVLVLLSAVSVGVVHTLVMAPRVGPQNVLGECALTFDDAAALGALPDQASYTFAPNYRMQCGPHVLKVDDHTMGHFHLSFEDPNISCLAEGGLGKPSGNDCVAVDWDHEPRFLQSHVQEHWIKIWMEDTSNQQPRAFDLRRIHVGAGYPIQLWFRTQDGTWWFWNELNDGKNWKLEKWSKDVMEVRIRGTNSGLGAYAIRNAYVRD